MRSTSATPAAATRSILPAPTGCGRSRRRPGPFPACRPTSCRLPQPRRRASTAPRASPIASIRNARAICRYSARSASRARRRGRPMPSSAGRMRSDRRARHPATSAPPRRSCRSALWRTAPRRYLASGRSCAGTNRGSSGCNGWVPTSWSWPDRHTGRKARVNPTLSEDVPLAGLTTLEVGGPARWLARAGDPAAVYRCIELARDKGVPFVVLGGGSNVVVADAGFPGIVIQPTDQACKVEESGEDARVEAGAGLDWDRFVDTMVGRGLAGVECLSGIPGRVGAVPIQNVGAYGQEVADTIDSVTALDAATGDIVTLANAECGFGNRTSRFKAASRERHIVLRVAFRLSRRG